jgi:ankyrin repeat protein
VKKRLNDTLLIAASNGNLYGVKSALATGADVNATNKYGGTALLIASMYGYIGIVKLLLDQGAVIDARSANGTTALMMASRFGYIDVVKLLLDRGADVHAKNDNGIYALTLASNYGYQDIAELLKSYGTVEGSRHSNKIKSTSANEDLVHAVLVGSLLGVRSDLNQSVYIDTGTDHIDTASMLARDSSYSNKHNRVSKSDAINNGLLQAATYGDLEGVKSYLERGADINAKTNNGCTALMFAIGGDYLGIAKFLLDSGADVNAKDIDGWTALMYASWFGYVDIAKLLLNYGADINAKNVNGYTALIWARDSGWTDIVSLLKSHGAVEDSKGGIVETSKKISSFDWDDPKYKQIDFRYVDTPITFDKGTVEYSLLEALTEWGWITYLDELAANGVSVEYDTIEDVFKVTPTIIAITKKRSDDSSHSNSTNKYKRTSVNADLFDAVEDGDLKEVKSALNQGADVNAMNAYGWTPLMVASLNDYTVIVKLLLESGADANVKDDEGSTALNVARSYGYHDIVDLLKSKGAIEGDKNENKK